MRIALSIALIAHGVAHLVGFVVPLALCALGWPEARIGVAVNVVLLGVLLLMPQLATVTP